MKILVLTATFSCTGVPLAQLRLARALSRRGHEVKAIFCSINPSSSPSPSNDLNIEYWNHPHVRSVLWPLVCELYTQKPDILFVAEDHLTAIALLAALVTRSSVKISGSSRILPSDRFAYSQKPFSKGWYFKHVMSFLTVRASALTCVSEDMVLHYKTFFPKGPHVCVYNIIKDSTSEIRAREPVSHPWLKQQDVPVIISAGTFTKRKGFFDLLEAFALANRKRALRLILLGDGYLRSELEDRISSLGIADVVDLPGNVKNPLAYFYRSNVFVLSSYAEGLPNVLVEAMICGCTPVSTDCPTGPRELLQDGRIGYLVPMRDPPALASAIETALDFPTPKALLDMAVAPFEEDRVINKHFQVLGIC